MGFTRTSSAALKLLINVGYFPVHVNLDLFKYDVRITYTEEVLSAAEELLVDRPDSDMVYLVYCRMLCPLSAYIHAYISDGLSFSISERIFQL